MGPSGQRLPEPHGRRVRGPCRAAKRSAMLHGLRRAVAAELDPDRVASGLAFSNRLARQPGAPVARAIGWREHATRTAGNPARSRRKPQVLSSTGQAARSASAAVRRPRRGPTGQASGDLSRRFAVFGVFRSGALSGQRLTRGAGAPAMLQASTRSKSAVVINLRLCDQQSGFWSTNLLKYEHRRDVAVASGRDARTVVRCRRSATRVSQAGRGDVQRRAPDRQLGIQAVPAPSADASIRR